VRVGEVRVGEVRVGHVIDSYMACHTVGAQLMELHKVREGQWVTASQIQMASWLHQLGHQYHTTQVSDHTSCFLLCHVPFDAIPWTIRCACMRHCCTNANCAIQVCTIL
jgi:hypothetical protein